LHIQRFSIASLCHRYRRSLLLTLEAKASLVDFSARVLLRWVRTRWKVRALCYCEQSRSNFISSRIIFTYFVIMPKTVWKRCINFKIISSERFAATIIYIFIMYLFW